MTEEKMIPISVIDARIEILKKKEYLTYINEPIPSWIIINELEYLKKEATLESMEQKIKDRIAQLEKLNWSNQVIDELRKLLGENKI